VPGARNPYNSQVPSAALVLILVAACVHVIPHASIKSARNRNAFVWWMLAGNAILYAPLLVWIPAPTSPRMWMLILASGALEVVYLFAVGRSYATGDLSVAYPLARGSAPLFLLGFALIFLKERPTAIGISGILLIASGAYLINLPELRAWRAPLEALRLPSARWALLAGLLTATYTSVDKIAVHYADPLIYIYLVLVATLVLSAPVTWRVIGRDVMLATLRGTPLRLLIAAATMPLAYALVLTAMKMGVLASYAGSVREVGVIVAALVGVLAFGERVSLPRLAGACAIAGGIVLIAIHG
jgi:drug/metabolite transporter (DMT)-like permease